MDKYTFIFNNSLQNNFYTTIKREIDNPFSKIIIEEETLIKLCKNYYNYLHIEPCFKDNKIFLNDINFTYLDTLENFKILLNKSKNKTPFFIFKNNYTLKEELKNIKNLFLFENDISEFIDYFNLRNPEENIIYHVYTLCYNESRLIEHFLNHYKTADRIIVYDNNSTDNSIEILKKYNREFILFNTNNSFNDTIHQKIKNNVWKQSKDTADFVIVQDLDEFLHFPDYPYNFKKGLYELNKFNPTFVICKGYDMACSDEEFKNIPIDKPIFNYITKGIFNKHYCKPNLINPKVIEETNWTVGNHGINPIPYTSSNEFEILLLHYKHTGIEWEIKRRLELKIKLEKCYHGYGTEYLLDKEEMTKYVKEFYTNAVDISNKIFRRKITGSVIEHEYDHRGLAGGLGNQLFNVFTTLALSIKYNLCPFFISRPTNTTNYKYNVFKKINIINDYNLENFYKIIEPNQTITLNFDIIDKIPDNILIQGYCQSSKYFDCYKDEIISNYINLDYDDQIIVDNYINYLKKKFRNKKLVAIHIRRGDYIQLGWNLPISYYLDCIKEFDDTNVFIIFTDDKEWCKLNFNYTICDINIDYIELFIMSKMDSIIISNSTFSWWGAYLGNNKKVFCPYPWFKVEIFNEDIYVKDWIKINY